MTTSAAQQAAWERGLRVYPPRKPDGPTHLARAYYRGACAALAGRPIDVCPYKRDPYKTWRGTYRAAWIHGYQSVVVDQE